MLTLDGSAGEGGGQILRTALSLATVTGQPFRIEHIRARRLRPGLMRQHLAAVEAARAITGADVEGAVLGSAGLTFRPGALRPGTHRFQVGSAGSACLVFQTLLPALLTAPTASHVVLEGGTHNPMAPPFDFLDRVFVPAVRRMGPVVTLALERHGFYPAGGGRFSAAIRPCRALAPLELVAQPDVTRRRACAVLARVPRHVAERELAVVQADLGWSKAECEVEVVDAAGSGNVLLLEVAGGTSAELVAGFGARGIPAEIVAGQAVAEMRAFLDARVPVGAHLADQLLVPLALAGGGAFRTLPLSAHARTNIDVIHAFGIAQITVRSLDGVDLVEVRRARASHV